MGLPTPDSPKELAAHSQGGLQRVRFPKVFLKVSASNIVH